MAVGVLLLLMLAGVALVRGMAGEHSITPSTAHPGAVTHAGLSSLPLRAQGVISTTLGGEDHAYRLSRSGEGYGAVNPAQRLSAHFDRAGVRVRAGKSILGLRLDGIGFGASLAPLTPTAPRADGNRLVYTRAGLDEWYANGPLGLEQGFTVTSAPAGDTQRPLALSLALAGNARASLDANGRGLTLAATGSPSLRYDKLLATDARHRALHSWITLQPGRVLLHVDTRGARYPLRIDPLIQQGPKLTGAEETGEGNFGYRVALSADGNTALIGGYLDAKTLGAAWVFTRSGGKWTQQAKLTGKEETGEGAFGSSVALSADGNTALIGGYHDNKSVGAAWVFTRSEGKWTQLGAKLTAKEETGAGGFGDSVALSADGKTALIGGLWDNANVGAAWVFTRSEEKWSQQAKLTGKEEVGEGVFGASVALSSDGNTALVGGYFEKVSVGAAWVFTRSEAKWTQQGGKLTGKEETGGGSFGISVALSADGNTGLVGGYQDNKNLGAVWVFTRSEGKWTQQAKLTASDELGEGGFGFSVALDEGGNKALIGAPLDNKNIGAAWVFTRSEGKWTQQGAKITGEEATGSPNFGFSTASSSDASTALIGGEADNTFVGAAWVFVAGVSAEESYGCSNEAAPNLHWFCVEEAINSATGNLSQSQTDLAVDGRGPGLSLTRTYNSKLAAGAAAPGAFGYGWTCSYCAHLEINETASTATVVQSNGSTAVFAITASKEFLGIGPWVQATLAKEGANYVYTPPDQIKLEFSSEGKLLKETDRDGNSNTLTYKEGKLEKVEDGAKRTLAFTYNGEGLVETVTDPLKHVASYTYLTKNLASVTVGGKVRWQFGYEAPHLLTKLTDGREHTTTVKYEATTHRVSEQTRAGHIRKMKYGTSETTLTEPNGSETLMFFNSAAEPTKTVVAKGKAEETTAEYGYEAGTFNRTKTLDGNKHETKYSYDAEGNKTSEADPNKDERKWTYDKKHDVLTETTPEGETTTYKLNAHADPEVVERPIGAETQKTEYKYNEKGDLTEAIDPLKHATKYTYDGFGDKETETDPEGNERKWKSNEDSQVVEETSPRKFVTKIERDEYGRPKKVTDPLGHIIEHTYDGDGNVESETDGNKHTTKYEYNEEDLPIKVTEPNGNTVETGYDSEGQMTSHTDGNKHVWEYKRNALEQVTEEKNPLGRVTKRKYDKAGNLESVEDPEKHTSEYKYDESDRLKAVKYSTGKPSETTYEYNKDSNLKKMTDETGTTENTYDKLDRLTEAKNGAKKVVKYEYNLANLPTKITYPNEKAVTRAYDKDNRLEQVTDWNSRSDGFTYNPDSELASVVYPAESKYEDKYAYNEADQMTEVKLTKGGETTASEVYARDSDGQLTKTTNKGLPGALTWEYKYDENNRLTEAGGLAYEYDKANNPTKIEGKGPYAYDAADELEKGAEGTYAYSEDGRRTETKPTKGPATTYGYDQVGNLTSVKRPEEGEVKKIEDAYAYDGTNLRQSQTINGATTHLTWDTAEATPHVLSDESNFYIYGPENRPIEQITSGGATQWMHEDQQGSMRAIMNLKGEIEASYTFNPYGSLNASSHAGNSLLRYDGEYASTDNGLTYLRARTYDPATAQFLSIDPAVEGTGEPYAYTSDNPVDKSDPSGMISGGCFVYAGGTLGFAGSVFDCLPFERRYSPMIAVEGTTTLDGARPALERIHRAHLTTHIVLTVGAMDTNAREAWEIEGSYNCRFRNVGFLLSRNVAECFRTARGTNFAVLSVGASAALWPSRRWSGPLRAWIL